MRPQRTEDGDARVVAEVRNTGERAIDLRGQLSLSDGLDSLSAGPFRITDGPTLAPGHRANVVVALSGRLPDGPWKFRLTVQSGTITRTASGTLTFPEKRGMRGLPAALDSPLPLTLTVTGSLVVLAALVLLVLSIRRLRGVRALR